MRCQGLLFSIFGIVEMTGRVRLEYVRLKGQKLIGKKYKTTDKYHAGTLFYIGIA